MLSPSGPTGRGVFSLDLRGDITPVTARSLCCLSLDRGLIWQLWPISEMQFTIGSVGDLPGRTPKP